MPAPVDRRLVRESAAARRHLLTAATLGAVDAVLIVAQCALLAGIIARSARHGVSVPAVSGELGALGAVLAGRALVRAGFELSGRTGATRVMSELRRRLVARLLIDVPGRRPRGLRTGELATGAVAGVDALQTYFAAYLPQLMLAAVVPPAVLVWAVHVDPITAGILAGSVPLLIGFMILIGQGTRAQTNRRHGALALLSAHFLDVVSGLETLRSYRREQAQQATLAEVGERYRRETMATLRIAFMSALVLELCAMIGTALVAATVGIQLCDGALSLQAGLTVLLLAPELYGPLREVGQQFHAAADGTAASERIFAVLEEAPAPNAAAPPSAETPSCPPMPAPHPAAEPIRLEGVSYTYPGRSRPALDALTLTLTPGAVTVLRGPSGSGKSTLARLLLGFDQPDSGRILCGSSDLRAVDPEAWRSRVAWLPQRPTLFTATVAENVALGTADADDHRVRGALVAAGAAEFVDALPDGVATVIGEGGRRLSAGQRQRIGLARALLCDAELLILDEPTAHVDAGTAAAMRAAIGSLLRDRTVLLIAHDRGLEDLADHNVWLDAGTLVWPGAPEPAASAAAELAA